MNTVSRALVKPDWLRIRHHSTSALRRVQEIVERHSLNTVCYSAACPNLAECWSAGTATFMIGGNVCTRACGFCDVRSGRPLALDEEEPEGIAKAVALLGLNYVVITCVARDDLADGGAGQMARTLEALREYCPGVGVEVLISDYRGCPDALQQVLDANPTVLSHNLETVERLQRSVRSSAHYARSLAVLERAYEVRPEIPLKSGIMLGLGESDGEVDTLLKDLVTRGVSLLTIGQYLCPSPKHLPVDRFVHPDEFLRWDLRARELGFLEVASGPLVRSSYRAERLMRWKSNALPMR